MITRGDSMRIMVVTGQYEPKAGGSDPGLLAGVSAASRRIISGHERHRLAAERESLYRMLAPSGEGTR